MKQSDLNHLRRLLGWISCEIGQSPAELVATVRNIASKIELPSDPEEATEAKQRLVEAHDEARRVPGYVRAAVAALQKALAEPGSVVDERQTRQQNIPKTIPAAADTLLVPLAGVTGWTVVFPDESSDARPDAPLDEGKKLP